MNKRIIGLIALLSGLTWIFLGSGRLGSAHAHPILIRPLPQDHSLRASQTITIEFGGPLGFAYSPKDVFLSPGDSLHWQGSFPTHPLVSDEGLWQMVDTGSEFTFTSTSPASITSTAFFMARLE